MEFIFRITGYDDPALDGEVPRALEQRLAAHSRETLPGLWAVTDRLNDFSASGPGRTGRRGRRCVYGVLLLALGIFALVPGLAEPRTPALIIAGTLGIAAGLLNFLLTREKKRPVPPASCRREAAQLLNPRRETDWETLQAEVRFDGAGWSVATGEGESRTAYDKLRGIFETERIWLLVYGRDMALLLQKKDLTAGDPEKFLPYLQEKITN